MTNIYYALDTVGYVKEPAAIAERILADYLGTNFSQSIIFFGKLKSLQHAIQVNAGNMSATADAIQNDLNTLLSAYLDSVTVNVVATPILNTFGQETAQYEMLIEATFSTGKGMESLASTIRETNEGFKRIASIVSN